MNARGGRRALEVQELPASWFDRTGYRPRVPSGSRDAWFILHPAFAPLDRVPGGPAPEPAAGRESVRRCFEQTYEGWGLPRTAETERSLGLVGERGTAVIVAGQQPGFLGGPLLTLYKALTAVAAARDYRALTGSHCVPVFWVAGDDHDLDEVRDALFPGPEPGGIAFRFPAEADRRPLSDYPVDADAIGVLDAARAHLERRPHGSRALELLELYRGRGLAGGFAAILARLLGPTGLLVLDPATVRPLAAPLLRRVIEHPEATLACIERGRRDVRASGMEPIVSGRFPLFLQLEGKRHHLTLHAEGLKVDGGGPGLSRDGLLRTLAERPGDLSPGALLRPCVQQAALPCVLTVGGPAEVGYFAQLGPLAEYLGVERPRIGLRVQATLVEGKTARTASSLTPEILATATSPEALVLADEDSPGARALRALAGDAEGVLESAIEEVAATADASRLRSQARKLLDGTRRFAEAHGKARASLRTQELEAAKRLWDFVFPAGGLQERTWCGLHFVSRHGTAWIDELLGELEGDALRVCHRWVTFLPEDGPEDGSDGEC